MAEVSQPAVSLRGVSKWYDDTPALYTTDLDIQEGETLTLLGPSGSGKSTILRLVAGFIEPSTGAVLLRGKDVTDLTPQKRNTAMVFQSYALFPHMSVADNLAFGLRMRKEPKAEIQQRVDEALRLIRLDDFGTRLPKQLSGGEQQRVALMRALITEPDVLLMDEPLGALDRKLREHMQIEIKSFLMRMRATTLYVTHDQEEALVLSDRIAVINQGVIEQIDTPERIYDEPATPFVADFVGVSNMLQGTIKSIDEEGTKVEITSGTVISAPDTQLARNTPVRVVIRPEKIRVRSLDEPVGAPNAIEGTLQQTRYLGLSIQYVVDAPGGNTIIATELRNETVGSGVAEGTPVRLEFQTDAPRLLPVPSESRPDEQSAGMAAGMAPARE